jgi:hypothetical protein
MNQQNAHDADQNRINPKWSGFFIAAWFLGVGAILFYTPCYIGISGWLEKLIDCFGWISIIISFVGISIELSNIFKSDGLSYLGVSSIFLIPAILIHILQSKYISSQTGIVTSKVIVIMLLIIGSGLLFYGVSFFIEDLRNKDIKTEVAATTESGKKRKSIIELASPILIAILALVAAIFQFISKLSGK